MVTINGEKKDGYENSTIAEMVEKEGFSIARIAIEVNGSIVSKKNYNDTLIHAGDVIEVVSFVGGG